MAFSVAEKRQFRDWLWAFLFIAPTTIGLYLFFLYPIVGSVVISFTKWNHLTKPEFVGLANYLRLISDPEIRNELFNTLFFMVVSVPLTIFCSLLLANGFNGKAKGTGFYRTVFFLPYVVLPVVTAQLGMTMFNSKYGIINRILELANLPQPQWLAGPWSLRLVIVAIGLWASIGYYSIVLLAGLQNIPSQYYEACDLEGCGPVRKFFLITIPLVTPQIFFASVMAVISSFKMFDYIFIFGKGNQFARNSIRTLAFGIYERGFTFMEMGYASAEAILLCVLMLVFTVVQNVGQKKWVHYE